MNNNNNSKNNNKVINKVINDVFDKYNPLKYGLLLCIYFILFFCLYTSNLEINGLISLFFVNLFISVILVTDLNFDNNADTVLYKNYVILIIIIGILCNIIASFIISSTLIYLKIKYNTIHKYLHRNKYNNTQLNNYKSLFVTNVLVIFSLIIGIIYYPIFSNLLKFDNNLLKFGKKHIAEIFFDVFTSLLAVLVLFISGYIIYVSNSLSTMWYKNIIIIKDSKSKDGELSIMKPIEQTSWRAYDFKRYFTPQYIINSKLS